MPRLEQRARLPLSRTTSRQGNKIGAITLPPPRKTATHARPVDLPEGSNSPTTRTPAGEKHTWNGAFDGEHEATITGVSFRRRSRSGPRGGAFLELRASQGVLGCLSATCGIMAFFFLGGFSGCAGGVRLDSSGCVAVVSRVDGSRRTRDWR